MTWGFRAVVARRSTTHLAIIGAALGLCFAAATLNSQGTSPRPTDQSAAAGGTPLRWYKGNTHTHTINQGGDSTPDAVASWYREHGYQFLVLSDHNFLTRTDALNAVHGAAEKFLLIPGEEVTSRGGDKPVHINGLDIDRLVEPYNGSTVLETLQRNIDGIRAASGVPHINHPNHQWAMTADDLRQARNYKLFEIHSGHPGVNNLGGGGVPGLEQVWDQLLSSGMMVYGIAVDDAHVFKDPGNPRVSGPGRGWVVVRAPRLEARAPLDALERGDFYASTGVVLEDVRATANDLTVAVKQEGVAKYVIQFIGRGGRILREATEPTATYAFTGDEGYVRAKVIESNGRLAWVQPVQVPGRTSARLRSLWNAIVARL